MHTAARRVLALVFRPVLPLVGWVAWRLIIRDQPTAHGIHLWFMERGEEAQLGEPLRRALDLVAAVDPLRLARLRRAVPCIAVSAGLPDRTSWQRQMGFGLLRSDLVRTGRTGEVALALVDLSVVARLPRRHASTASRDPRVRALREREVAAFMARWAGSGAPPS